MQTNVIIYMWSKESNTSFFYTSLINLILHPKTSFWFIVISKNTSTPTKTVPAVASAPTCSDLLVHVCTHISIAVTKVYTHIPVSAISIHARLPISAFLDCAWLPVVTWKICARHPIHGHCIHAWWRDDVAIQVVANMDKVSHIYHGQLVNDYLNHTGWAWRS